MENINKEDNTWQANYYFRMKSIATKRLKEFETMGVKPNHTDRKVKKYTLKDYIEFLGQREAAEKFGCSEASCKSWRYGYRQPTINQAKQIIKATDGRLDYESIYGPISEILVTEA
jgi:hypothetical protein|tara:strand:+ start:283 stop:630 length:348 start_codon:yes stop_codon:yes gene_type:complete